MHIPKNTNLARILLIHAGGFSKRLPSHTIGGKIFCPIPFFLNNGNFKKRIFLLFADLVPKVTNQYTKIVRKCVSMLEMKLIMFVEFPSKMKPGVFLTCADDLTFFDSSKCDFTKGGFTALAHPSTIEIGKKKKKKFEICQSLFPTKSLKVSTTAFSYCHITRNRPKMSSNVKNFYTNPL